MPKHTRRALALLALGAALAASATPALAQTAPVPAPATGPSAEALAAPSALGDKVVGVDTAPVTIVEYASMSCPHCGEFHRTTWDALKQQYIDTGKVRFIFREFPLNAEGFAVSMLARCAPADRFYDVVDTYFDKQPEWLTAQNPYEAIFTLSQSFGFTKESFDACLSNQGLFEGMQAELKRASETFGVSGTPTFFINGERKVGGLSLEEVGAAVGSVQ